MTTSLRYSLFDVTYPDSDGLPMAESDATRDYLIYGVEKFVREALWTQHESDRVIPMMQTNDANQ
ncbi:MULTISPECIES: hypothetical protein [Planktothricoides]|uniref:Uncharacterized protein n=1 Tax=Planktothricoides raciborskii GIHE-MW2 TaxID=2792601 RepID=A0AAU8J9I6_9CYAN|nr:MULTISPECIES: hypothetical protein [Planktothricoides]